MTKGPIVNLLIISAVFLIAVFQRLIFFNQTGKDSYAYERAVTDLIDGTNPYKWTIESYSNPDDLGNHGYAYLPGFLYINYIFYLISLLSHIPFVFLQKLPVLLADFGIGILLVKTLYKRSYPATLFALLIWFCNPYFYIKNNYVYNDPLPIFFMLLALYFLEKDDVLTGTFYAISIVLKTFPLVLLPIMLLKSKSKLCFLTAAAMIGIFISIPFLDDIPTYLKGAVFIHGDRFVQGRPFLFYISYFYKIEFFQIIPFKVYTYLSLLSGWAISLLFMLTKWLKDKYIVSIFPFLTFYLFTPVLNKTYLMWFLPVFILGTYNVPSNKWRTFIYFSIISVFWLFNYWYLSIWKDGFNIWRPL